MKRLVVGVVLLVVGFCVGCSHKQPKETLHVTGAQLCADVDLVATYEGKEYRLSADRKSAPLAAACYDPIRPEEVGKDYHATIDPMRGQILVDLPETQLRFAQKARYNIESVREIQQ